MRIVMPLFDFWNKSSEEFEFDGSKYALRKFNAEDEIPQVPGLSELDIEYIKQESWALVAEDPDLNKYRKEVNMLLLAFRIYKLARVFIKYRLCMENPDLCSKLNEHIEYTSLENSTSLITPEDLKIIDNGFSNLLKMDAISNRTHNTIYFVYRGFSTIKWMDAFMLLMIAIESLFSDEKRRGATGTICSRVSAFLDSKARCEHKNIEHLYDIRSQIVHGKIVVDDEARDNLAELLELEYVVTECMKKMLDGEVYTIYEDVERKEAYYSKLTKRSVR